MNKTPFVSVLMPVRNEALFIERSLGAALAQDYPLDRMEVIIADGLSTDGTREIIARVQNEHLTVFVKVVDNPRQIVSTGMNAAFAHARGEVIIRIDGHTVVDGNYVSECVNALHKSGAENAGGAMHAIAENIFGSAVSAATSSRFGVGGARFHYSDREEWVDTVYLGAWPRDVFRRIGVFDEEMVHNQDDELNYRLRGAGGRIFLCPRIKSCYYNRATVRLLWKQYLQYGHWKVRVMQKHPRQMQPRQFVPALFVFALVLLLITAPFLLVSKLVLAVTLLAYAVFSFAASISAARKTDWRLLPLLPMAFTVIHFAYGSGFLLGLARFWNRWRDHGTRASQSPWLHDAGTT